MAGYTLMFTPATRDFGRSGYNKDDEKPKGDKGRSGYNKTDDNDDTTTTDKLVNFGRSGYNKDDEKPKNGGRSGYN